MSQGNATQARKPKKRRVINTHGLTSKGPQPRLLPVGEREPAFKRVGQPQFRRQHVPSVDVSLKPSLPRVDKRFVNPSIPAICTLRG
jgi:hypothetical protein